MSPYISQLVNTAYVNGYTLYSGSPVTLLYATAKDFAISADQMGIYYYLYDYRSTDMRQFSILDANFNGVLGPASTNPSLWETWANASIASGTPMENGDGRVIIAYDADSMYGYYPSSHQYRVWARADYIVTKQTPFTGMPA